ncbi:MAG: hypothetical protein M9920_15490 [Verrucomicrobiae bacterium]|nr:hypothetical protein [Verrucomicrobiae bacterium]
MMGLKAYCETILKREFPEPVVIRPGIVAAGRLLCVEDENELSTLFMWRRDRETGEWFKIKWDAVGEQFDKDDLGRMGAGQFIITDEAWKCYSSRRWKDSEKVTEFYGRQHRKFGDDWHLVSHSHKDLDVQINRMAQQWQICTNFGLRRLGIFRQPPVFQVRTFYEPPSSASARAFHTTVKRLDVRVVQTYDTSAGVAVGGGRGADVKRRRKGISIVWLIIGVILFVVGLAMLPHVLGGSFKFYMKRTLGVKPAMPQTQHSAADVAPGVDGVGVTPAPAELPPMIEPEPQNPVKLEGWAVSGGRLRVILSDGRIVTMKEGLRKLDSGKWWFDGKEYEQARPRPGVFPPAPSAQPWNSVAYSESISRESGGVSVSTFGSRPEPRTSELGAGRARFMANQPSFP